MDNPLATYVFGGALGASFVQSIMHLWAAFRDRNYLRLIICTLWLTATCVMTIACTMALA
jgi:hypothetical protein